MSKKFSSIEEQRKWRSVGELTANLPNIENLDKEIKLRILSTKDIKRLKSGNAGDATDSAFGDNTEAYSIKSGKDNILYLEGKNTVRNTEEYKKLKEKFEKQVKELEEKMKKKEIAERKEKPEATEKPEQ